MLFMYGKWGAVAYLTYSSYGRNGNKVGLNKNVTYTDRYCKQ